MLFFIYSFFYETETIVIISCCDAQHFFTMDINTLQLTDLGKDLTINLKKALDVNMIKPLPRHITIPVFLPQLACPHQCVFCNQNTISGTFCIPTADEISHKINQHLQTITIDDVYIEIGFFGGSFTGLAPELQRLYLDIAQEYCLKSRVKGIRLSTRPDYIDDKALDLLSEYSVHTIELGAQSFDDEVLRLSGRGHTANEIRHSSKLVRSRGFKLGLQMMAGLPGDTLAKTIATAKEIAALQAQDARIYPALVIKDTPLAELYQKGLYQPLTLDEAVLWSKNALSIMENAFVNVIRVGLHPGSELQSGESLLAGPFHPAFKELVSTELWADLFKPLISLAPAEPSQSAITIVTAPGQLNSAAGYQGKNRKLLDKHFTRTRFKADPNLTGRHFHVIYH